MSFKSNTIRLIIYLNEEKIFPFFLIIYTLFLALFNISFQGIFSNLVLFFLILIPFGIRFPFFTLVIAENVNHDKFRFLIDFIKNILNGYGINLEEKDLKIKRDDSKNFAIHPFSKKVFPTLGFMKWASENTDEKENYIKAILGHEVTHSNRFKNYYFKFIIYPVLIMAIFLVYGFLFSTIFIVFGTHFFTFQVINYLSRAGAFLSFYLVGFWVVRQEEYIADKGSVELGNLPSDIIEALFSILDVTEEDIMIPPKIIEIFNTHPSIVNRIKELRALEKA